MDERTRRAQQKWDKRASAYDRSIAFFEKVLFGGGREWVCSQAQGDVLEIAAGTGRNFPFYPPNVRLTAVEFSPKMLDIAAGRARELGREVDLRLGDAQALDFPDETFDTVVCTLSLCSIQDDRKAVAEATRVLRPGGRLLLLEHVRSPITPVRSSSESWNHSCGCRTIRSCASPSITSSEKDWKSRPWTDRSGASWNEWQPRSLFTIKSSRNRHLVGGSMWIGTSKPW